MDVIFLAPQDCSTQAYPPPLSLVLRVLLWRRALACTSVILLLALCLALKICVNQKCKVLRVAEVMNTGSQPVHH